ncbi:MAG: hypothetical protein K2J10_09120, partial [Muribaculaceae bacterium]|nr:hypothetical protein [Muribaculaceae bacterium]
GYLLFWSRSLWIPIFIHASNNIMYVTWQWIYGVKANDATPIDTIGTNGDLATIAISIVITVGLLVIIFKRRVCLTAND